MYRPEEMGRLGPKSTAEGLASSLKTGFKIAGGIPDVLQLAGMAGAERPSVGQERRAFERAMTDPSYFSASTIPGVDPLAVESRFGPPAKLQMLMSPQVETQKALAQDVAQRQAEIAALPRSAAQQRLAGAKTQGEKWAAWLQDPVELTAGIMLESLPPSIAGAVAGSLIAGPGAGTALGVGAASGLTTFSSEFLGDASQKGYDVANPESLQEFVNNPKDFENAFNSAAIKSGIVGEVDAITGGVAGKFLQPALKEGLRKTLLATGKEIGMQAVGGAGGEFAGQVASGQPIDPFDIAMEALAEIGTGPAEIASNIKQASQIERTPNALYEKGEAVSGNVFKPEIAQEGAQQVPAEVGGGAVAQARVELPELRPGDRRIQIEQTDPNTGEKTIIDAVTNGQSWEIGGQSIPNVGRPVEGLWSDGPLRPNERIIEAPQAPAAPETETGGTATAVAPEVTQTQLAEQLGFRKLENSPYHRLDSENGYVTADFSLPDRIEIHGLGVYELARGKGQGSKLIQAIKNISDQTGSPITLTAHAESPSVQPLLNKFYEQNGFVKSGADPLSKKPFYIYRPAPSPEPATVKSEAEIDKVLPDSGVSQEPVGMGAATPSEFKPPTPFKTSNKNATVDAERKARGLPPMMDVARQSNQSAWDAAMRAVDENPQIQDELIAELASQPRALTMTENALLLHRRIDLRNEYEKALHRWRDAFEHDDFVRAAEESQRVRDWSSKLSDLESVTKATGAESGRSLQARKMMADEDFSLAAMELGAMEAKGRHLTAEEHLELIRAHEKISDLERRLSELEGKRESKEVEEASTSTMTEVEKEAPKEAKSSDFDIDREETLLDGIKAKVAKGQVNDITSLVQKLARLFWRRGIRKRGEMLDTLHSTLQTVIPGFTLDQTKRAFSGYGNFKPLSKEAIDVGLRDLKGQTQQVLKMEALESKKPLEKTGQERRTPSDEERRLIKQVNELKRKYGVVVTDPATQLKSALAARKTYYEHRIADLKHEIETRQRIVKTKTPSPTDPQLEAMIAEHERLKAEHAQIFTKPEMTDEQRLKMAIAAAQRNQAHWEARLENAEKGVFDKRVPRRKVTSTELELIQAETAAIREHVKELHDLANPKKTKEEIALQSLKTRMATQTAALRERISKGDFTKKERKPVKLDPEGLKIKAELDLAREEFNTKLEQDRWARMSVFQKTRRKIANVYDAARALMTTGELSFILRQGKLAVLSHPIQTAKALPDMFRALLASEQRAREIDAQTHSDPLADTARAAKLYLVEEGVSLHKQEEILMGRWVRRILIVKNFNRAAQVFLNRIRLDMWKAMRKSLSKSGTPTPQEDLQIAMFVNEATGRGGLGKLEPAAVPLARVMFSPRYYASRLQLASGHSLWGGTMRTRRIIATEYARALVGLGLYYTALSMLFSGDDDEDKGKIEADPRSSDFGKVQMGNTRLDPLAGLSQVIVLGARTASGEKKTLAGKVEPIRGKQVKFGGDKWSDIVARHLRGKLHPVPSAVANLFDGTDLGGDEATLINQTQNMVAPITYMDIYAALKEQGLDDGAALALLALLGEGLQTYEKQKK